MSEHGLEVNRRTLLRWTGLTGARLALGCVDVSSVLGYVGRLETPEAPQPPSPYFISYDVQPREGIFPLESRPGIVTPHSNNPLDQRSLQNLFTRPAEPLSPNENVNRVVDNLCRVHTFHLGSPRVECGSAVRVGEGVYLSAGHVFNTAIFPNFRIDRSASYIYDPRAGLITPVRSILVDRTRDFALVYSPTRQTTGQGVSLDSSPLIQDQQLWSLGFDGQIPVHTAPFMTVHTGKVDLTKDYLRADGYEDRVKAGEMLACLGTSGGPVVNSEGKVVGMNSGFYFDRFAPEVSREGNTGSLISPLSLLDFSRLTAYSYRV
jgi:hypothetical protein